MNICIPHLIFSRHTVHYSTQQVIIDRRNNLLEKARKQHPERYGTRKKVFKIEPKVHLKNQVTLKMQYDLLDLEKELKRTFCLKIAVRLTLIEKYMRKKSISVFVMCILTSLFFSACGGDSDDLFAPEDGDYVSVSSSSKKKSSSSSEGYDDEEHGSSSIFSSSSKSSSSSREGSSSSVGNNVELSSSSTKCPWTESEIPSKLYDCDIYDCISTGHLNPEVEYGEYLDERDNKVYRTIEVGGRIWMAQNMAYDCSEEEDFCKQYGDLYSGGVNPCPAGWEVPTAEDYDSLLKVHAKTSLYNMRAKSCIWKAGNYDWEDPIGFALLPAGIRSSKEQRYETCATYLWTFTLTHYGTESFMTSSCKQFLASRDYPSNGFSVRCVQSREKEVLDVAACRADSSKCVFGTMTDKRDGQVYKTATYGRMVWMTQNLNYEYKSQSDVDRGASFCYNNSKDSCAKYGRLYNMWAAGDSLGEKSSGEFVRGICPEGWHMPSVDEWNVLTRSFSYRDLVANFGSHSNVGFDLYLSGVGSDSERNAYTGFGKTVNFWTSTVNLRGDRRIITIVKKQTLAAAKGYWLDHNSVRCVKD